MAFDFGGIFDSVFKSFDTKTPQSKIENNKSSLNNLDEEMSSLSKTLNETEKELEKLDDQINKNSKDEKKKQELEKIRAKILERDIESGLKLDQLKSQRMEIEKQNLDLETQLNQARENQEKGFAKVIGEKIGSLFSQKKESQQNISVVGSENESTFRDKIAELTGSLGDGLSSFGTKIGSFAQEWGKKLLGPWGVLIGAIVVGITKAYRQVLELNKQMTDLVRGTGGAFSTEGSGFDIFGNKSGAGGSLKTEALMSNIDVGDVTKQVQQLSKSVFQFGANTPAINSTKKAMMQFGIEAAKISKIYGAEIGPATGLLVRDMGMSVKDATKNLVDGVAKAKAAGLDVSQFTDNMKEAADLIGQVTFKDGAEGMQKMALYATKMGMSINEMVNGMTKMKGLNDLFAKQQEAASLGMHNQAQQMSKIYALQKQGMQAEAAAVEQAAIIADLRQQGMVDEKGIINQAGLSTLEAMGKSAGDIKALQRVSGASSQLGLSPEEMLKDVSKLDPEKARKRESYERNNRTIEEQGNIILGSITQTFIDPLAKLIGPIVKDFMNFAEILTDIILKPIQIAFDALQPAITIVTTAFHEVFQALEDIFVPIQKSFNDFRQRFQSIINIASMFGKVLTQWVLLPLRVLGKLIGGVIDIIGVIGTAIWDSVKPIIDAFDGIFDSMGDGNVFQSFLDGVSEVTSFITDVVGTAFSILLKPVKLLAEGLAFIIKGFMNLTTMFENFVDWISGVLGLGEEDIKNDNGSFDKAVSGLSDVVPQVPKENLKVSTLLSTSREQVQNEQGIQKSLERAYGGSAKPSVNIQIKNNNSLGGEMKNKITSGTT